jgi:regulator of replication initiation timing
MINKILNRPSRKELRAEIDRLQKRLHSCENGVATAARDWAKTDCFLRSKIENLELACVNADNLITSKNDQIVKLQTELSLVQTESESFKKGAMKQIIDLKKDVNFWSAENEKFFKSNSELKAKLEKFEAAKKKRDEKNAEFMRNKRAQNPNYGRNNKK